MRNFRIAYGQATCHESKKILFYDTDKGAYASTDVMSIIETTKRSGLDVYGYLLYLLIKLPEWGDAPTDEHLKTVMP